MKRYLILLLLISFCGGDSEISSDLDLSDENTEQYISQIHENEDGIDSSKKKIYKDSQQQKKSMFSNFFSFFKFGGKKRTKKIRVKKENRKSKKIKSNKTKRKKLVKQKTKRKSRN